METSIGCNVWSWVNFNPLPANFVVLLSASYGKFTIGLEVDCYAQKKNSELFGDRGGEDIGNSGDEDEDSGEG